jgi:tetratricopeptide (TPR) repeat protein
MPSLTGAAYEHPQLAPWLVVEAANLGVKERRLQLDPPHLSAKITVAVAAKGQLYSAQAGACGGMAAWGADDSNDYQLLRSLSDPREYVIALPEYYPDRYRAVDYPVGLCEVSDDSSAGINPLRRPGDWFMLTSASIPSAKLEPLINLLAPGPSDMMAHVGDVLEMPFGSDFVAALVTIDKTSGAVESSPDTELETERSAAIRQSRARARGATIVAKQLQLSGARMKAIRSFEEAARADPSNVDSWLNLSNALWDSREENGSQAAIQQAIEESFENAIKVAGRDGTKLARIGWALLDQGNSLAASDVFDRARKANPEYGDHHYWYAYSLRLMGRTDERVVDAFRRSAINDTSDKSLQWLGTTLILADRAKEAVEALVGACRVAPGNIMNRFWLGVALARDSRYDSAIPLLTDVLKVRSDMAGALYWYAVCAHEMGHDEESQACLHRAIQTGDQDYSQAAQSYLESLNG